MSVADSDATARLRVLVRRLALAAAALTFVVIVASAFMRHTQAGLVCDDWPACYGTIEAWGADMAPSIGVRLARIAHRLAATGVLALFIGMLLVAWTQKPAWKREGLVAIAALAIAAALAVLGIVTPGARVPAVTLGNLLGGYLMLALCAATYVAACGDRATGSVARNGESPGPTSRSNGASQRPSAIIATGVPLRWIALAALVLAFAQAGLGTMIGAQYALTACPTLGKCPGLPVQVVGTAAFDPFRPLSIVAGRVVPPADAAGVYMAHRVLGVLVALVTLIVAHALRRADRRTARLLAAFAVGTPLLGVAAILALPSLPFTVLHNGTAALLVATLTATVTRR